MVKTTETTYECLICKHKSSQISHHNLHLTRKTHKKEREILKLKFEKVSKEKLIEEFGKSDVEEILTELENHKIVVEKKCSPVREKLRKTNTIIYKKQEKEISKNNSRESFKNNFLSFVTRMHNLLRGCAVTGDDALDDILHCLFLCSINQKFNKKFSFESVKKQCSESSLMERDLIDDETIREHIQCLNIDYLIENEGELRTKSQINSIQKCAKILSIHPLTEKIFKDQNFINCPDTDILKSLLSGCKNFSIKENIFEQIDIIGLAYEYMTTKHGGNGGTSKEMGQYFTERPLMEMCFQLIDKQDIKELKIDNNSTLGDEFCATFGFPIMGREFLKLNFDIKIKDSNIFGVEYHERLSRFAYMNAIFSMKEFSNVKRGDSFVTNVSPHLDISVHNVPFGKSMTPKNIEKSYNSFLAENPGKGFPEFKDYVPFNTKKIDAILASQVVLYKTKKMGLMIIKDGEETSGKSNDKYRKWFSENCIIKKIMKIPSGAFTCTGTKTVCIYFIKKEGQMTENIQFLQLSDNGNKITEICHVSMADMKQNNYSWDPNSYIVDEEMEKMMSKSNCEWKKLGDLFELKNGNFNSNQMDNEGDFPFYSCISNNPAGLCSKYNMDYEKYLLLVSAGGSQKNLCGDNVGLGKCYIVSGKTACRTNVYALIQKEKNNNIKYTYFYLDIFRNVTNSKAKFTTNLGVIGKDDINNLNIPIPNLEVQNQVVQILDDLVEQKQLLCDRKSGIERQIKYYFETHIKINNSRETLNQFGKICHTKGAKQLSKKDFINGDYFVIGGGQTPTGKHNAFNKPANSILCSQSGSYSGFISRYNTPIWASDCFSIHSTNSDVINENYLYYYLKYPLQNNIYKLQKGAGQPHVYSNDMSQLLLVIPNMAIQTEIVKYLDKLEAKKNSIDEEISDIDTLMKQVLEQSYN